MKLHYTVNFSMKLIQILCQIQNQPSPLMAKLILHIKLIYSSIFIETQGNDIENRKTIYPKLYR